MGPRVEPSHSSQPMAQPLENQKHACDRAFKPTARQYWGWAVLARAVLSRARGGGRHAWCLPVRAGEVPVVVRRARGDGAPRLERQRVRHGASPRLLAAVNGVARLRMRQRRVGARREARREEERQAQHRNGREVSGGAKPERTQ
eukprot:5874678-Prymnesium_polylepis.1